MARLILLAPGELSRDPRARRAAEAGVAEGWDVVAICGVGPGDPVPLDGVDIRRVGGQQLSRQLRRVGLGGMRRSRPAVRELRGTFRAVRLLAASVRLAAAVRRAAPAAVVHANDFDTLPAAWLASRRLGARLVYDAHELYADEEPDAPAVYRLLVRALEGPLARRAAAVVTVGDAIADELERRLRLPARPLVVLGCPPRGEVHGEPTSGRPLRAVYQGAAGPGRPLEDLLDAAEAAPDVHITVRVANADLDALRAVVAARGLDHRVNVVDPVAPDRLVAALAGFDVGLVINRPVTRNDELVLPNKLFEYLMAGLAVVAPRLPAMTPLIEAEGVGLTYTPASPADLGATLQRLANGRVELAAMRQRARSAALERYNAEAQRERLVSAWTG